MSITAMNPSGLLRAGKSFRRAGRALERVALRFRSYLLPAHVWTYCRLVRTHAGPPDGASGPCVHFDFSRVEIDNETGRYAFALVREFEALGFLTCYQNNFRFLATMQHKRHKRLLLDRPFRICRSIAKLPAGSVALEVSDRSRFPEAAGRRQIRVRYEEGWPQTDREVAMTYFVHPLLYDRWLACPTPDLAAPRSWRIFFAGKMADAKYSADTLAVKFGKMSRCAMLGLLQAALPVERLRRIETASDLEAPDAGRPAFVWANTARYKVPQSQWLEALERAEFFLACPGMDMPLCHNLIEALSRGAVPVLEHPEYLNPPLEHNVNCLVFHGPDELLGTFRRVFESGPEQIGRLRQGTYAYFQKHLQPGAFARRLLNLPHPRVDLLLNAYRAPK